MLGLAFAVRSTKWWTEGGADDGDGVKFLGGGSGSDEEECGDDVESLTVMDDLDSFGW